MTAVLRRFYPLPPGEGDVSEANDGVRGKHTAAQLENASRPVNCLHAIRFPTSNERKFRDDPLECGARRRRRPRHAAHAPGVGNALRTLLVPALRLYSPQEPRPGERQRTYSGILRAAA